MAHASDTKELKKPAASPFRDGKVARTTSDAEDMMIAVADELSDFYHRGSLEAVYLDNEEVLERVRWLIASKVKTAPGCETAIDIHCRLHPNGLYFEWHLTVPRIPGESRHATKYGDLRGCLMALSVCYNDVDERVWDSLLADPLDAEIDRVLS